MATTYTLIASNLLTGTAASVTFSAIPSTYTDLLLRVSARGDGSQELIIQPNSTNTSYTNRFLSGNGSAASSGTYRTDAYYNGELEYSTYTASTFNSADIYIPNYAGSTNKSASTDSVTENNATAAYIYMVANLLSNTTAISSLLVKPSSGNFVANSNFYLYGITKA